MPTPTKFFLKTDINLHVQGFVKNTRVKIYFVHRIYIEKEAYGRGVVKGDKFVRKNLTILHNDTRLQCVHFFIGKSFLDVEETFKE